MGLILKAAGANFEANAVSYIPPVADGLLYWGFLNDSVEKLGRNFAPEGAPVSVVGVPPVTSAGAVLDKNNHIKTQIQQTPSLTLIAVGNPLVDGAEQGMFISNYTSARPSGVAGTSFGASLYCNNDASAGTFHAVATVSSFSGVGGSASNVKSAFIYGMDITKTAFLAMTIDGTEKIVRAYNLGTSVSEATPAFSEAIDLGVTPFEIGGCPLTTYINNPRHLHFAAIYNRKLSKAELDLIYARVKPYLAARGVSV